MCVLNTCAAGARGMCSCAIYVNVQKYDNVNRYSNVNRVCIFSQPLIRFPISEKEYKRVLERKVRVPNLKLSWQEKVKVVFKL